MLSNLHNRWTDKGNGRRSATLLALLAISAGIATGRTAVAQYHDGERFHEHSWPFWGGNLENTHGSASEHAINVHNASRLQQKWVFQTAGDVSATPTVSQGSVYVPDWGGFLYRIDAVTGKAIWSHKITEYTGNPKSLSRNSPAIGPDQLVLGDQAVDAQGAVLLSVDKATGKLLWKTTVDPTFGAVITSSPVIVGNRVYVGVASLQEGLALQPGFKLSFRGSAVALDLQTGHVLWQTYTVPEGYTGGSVWGSNLAVDLRRNSLYLTSGNNYSVPPSVATCLAGAGTDAAAKLACLAPDDYLDAVLSLDLGTGRIKWTRRLEGADTWTVSCIVSGATGTPCPDPAGPDYDFGSGANLIRTVVDGKPMEAVGAGQKSGVYWALDPDTGAVLWGTQVGPGGDLGGIEWGPAVDNKRVYVAINDSGNESYTLQPENTKDWNAGSWAALDAATGAVLWQVPATGQNPLRPELPSGATGQVTAANGVMYAGALSGDMVALDGETGKLLWRFASGGSVISGPSIVDGVLYWGSGYRNPGLGGTGNNKLYAFSLPGEKEKGR